MAFFIVSDEIGDIYFMLKGSALKQYESLDDREYGVLKDMLSIVLTSCLNTITMSRDMYKSES